METFRVFDTAQIARTFRHDNGTGGWIFEDDETKRSTLFPPHMTPSGILRHPLTRGRSGNLIGSM